MQSRAHLGPRYRLDSAGSILGDAVLDLSGPCFVNSLIRRFLNALEQTTGELGPLIRGQLRGLFVQLLDSTAQPSHLTRSAASDAGGYNTPLRSEPQARCQLLAPAHIPLPP